MPACPVCQYHNPPEANKCQRCNWLIQNDLEISSDHEILTTCIPTLIKQLEDAHQAKNGLLSHIQILDPDIHKANNRKLDEIQEEIEKDKEQTRKHFLHLEELINELQSILKSKNNSSEDIAPTVKNKPPTEQNISSPIGEQNSYRENNNTDVSNVRKSIENRQNIESDAIVNRRKTQEQVHQENDRSISDILKETINEPENNLFGKTSDPNFNNNSNFISNTEESSLYSLESDRNTNIDSNLIDKPQEGSLYEQAGDHKSYKTNNDIENNVPDNAHNGSYQNFYRLIKRGELEVTKVSIPQETIEQARSGTQSELKFAEDKKGNYWIVDWQGVYCLIPKEKNLINQYQYANFQRVFNCQDYYEDYSKIEIIEPATVANYDGEHWRLERKGKIKFI